MKKIIYGLALVLGLGLLASCNNVYQVESAVSAHSETNYYTVTGTIFSEGKTFDADGNQTNVDEVTYTLRDDPLHTSIIHWTDLNDSNASDEWYIGSIPTSKEVVKKYHFSNGVKDTTPYFEDDTEDDSSFGLWITLKEIDGMYYFTQNQVTYELDDEAFCDDGDTVILKTSMMRYPWGSEGNNYGYQTLSLDLVFTKK